MPRHTPMLLALGALSCSGGPTITGTVSDVTGEPLAGTRVTLVGSLSHADADEDGTFTLSCKQGEHRIAVTHQGYISKDLELSVTEDEPYDLGRLTLIRIPEGKGLFLFDGAGYTTMTPGTLARRTDGPGNNPDAKAFCLDRSSSPANEVAAGTLPLYDKDGPDWRLWRLDDEGCARRLTHDGMSWKVSWSDRVETSKRQLQSDHAIHHAELEPGEYFVARWHAGTFAPDDAASAEAGGKRYGGYYLVAK